MKKRLLSLLVLSLLVLCLLPSAALAEETGSFPYVLDTYGLLTESQNRGLEEKAASLSESDRCALYLVIVDDYSEYSSDVYEAAKAIYTYYDLGYGEGRDGVLLLMSMGDRDYAFVGHGERGETICGYESSWLIEDAFLDNLRQNDWVGGFEDYFEACDAQLKKLDAGEDLGEGAEIIVGSDGLEYHSYNAPSRGGMSSGTKLLIIIAVPLIVALIVCSVFRAQMKTAKTATQANRYSVKGSLNLSVKNDRYTHTTETRRRIETDSGSRGGGGGGSSHHSGGGFSGRSGKF